MWYILERYYVISVKIIVGKSLVATMNCEKYMVEKPFGSYLNSANKPRFTIETIMIVI
jgi:glucose-6-phosphate 1-dehydrogenase